MIHLRYLRFCVLLKENFEEENSLTLSAVEELKSQHEVVDEVTRPVCRLNVRLEWEAKNNFSRIQSLITRGSPYVDMQYFDASPRVFMQQQTMTFAPSIDGKSNMSNLLLCGNGIGNYSPAPVPVQNYIELEFHPSDMKWILFFSEPVHVICSNFYGNDVPSSKSYFDLRTVKPLKRGMVRAVLVNNCTTGTNVRCTILLKLFVCVE